MVKTFEDWKGRHSDMQKIDKNIKKHDCGCITKHDDDGNVHVLFSCSKHDKDVWVALKHDCRRD